MAATLGLMIAIVIQTFLAGVWPARCWAGETPLHEIDVSVAQQDGKLVQGTARSHALSADQPREFGGTDAGPTPPETYAFSLGACVVSAIRFVAELEELPVSDIRARVRGILDFGKAMGLAPHKRAGFTGLTVTVSLEAPWSVEEKAAFVDRVIERCPVCDNTANVTPLQVIVK